MTQHIISYQEIEVKCDEVTENIAVISCWYKIMGNAFYQENLNRRIARINLHP
jgi:hypothetical protein